MTSLTDFFVVDNNGIPESVINSDAINEAGFTLALQLGAAGEDQDAINTAIATVLHDWDESARYVIVNALVQLSRDLVPMLASLTKTATGVDWHAHCAAMLAPGEYDPSRVDQAGDDDA